MIRVNGEVVSCVPVANIAVLERTWKSNDEVTLELPMSVTASYWYDGAAVIERGALIYALKLNENWEAKNIDDGSERNGEKYYQVTTDSPWNYCLYKRNLRPENLKERFVVEKQDRFRRTLGIRKMHRLLLRLKHAVYRNGQSTMDRRGLLVTSSSVWNLSGKMQK